MANPQAENGHVDIANEIIEALAKTYLSSYESQVLWAIFRKTYGWHKKEDWITGSQLVEMTGIAKGHISRTLKKLINRNIVNRNSKKLSFQKDYDKWERLPKRVTNGDWRNADNWQSNSIRKIKIIILKRDNSECVLCGNKKQLCVHHIDYNESNNEENNLITLCRSCHGKTNSKNQSQWILFLQNLLVTHLGEKLPKRASEVTQTGNKKLPKQVNTKETKETITKETIQKKILSRTFEKCEVVYQLTIYLEGKIMENNKSVQKRKESQLQSWCKDIDKLLRLDNANPDDVKKIIDWVVEDKFWAKNVQCAESLRKHYSRFYKEVISEFTNDPNRFDFIDEEEKVIE